MPRAKNNKSTPLNTKTRPGWIRHGVYVKYFLITASPPRLSPLLPPPHTHSRERERDRDRQTQTDRDRETKTERQRYVFERRKKKETCKAWFVCVWDGPTREDQYTKPLKRTFILILFQNADGQLRFRFFVAVR